jgi:hypothetical protein
MDITLCDGKNCPLKEKCQRFLWKSNSTYQSYFIKSPYNKTLSSCEHLIKSNKK